MSKWVNLSGILPNEMMGAAFWVLLTMITFVVWLVLQGYWTRWAHKRVDALSKEVEDQQSKMRELDQKLEAINKRTPQYPWLTKAN